MNLRFSWVCLFIAGLPAAAGAAERKLAVDFAQSKVEVAVTATVDSFVGRLPHYDPTITLGEDDRVTTARVTFHFRDFETGKRSRDEAMHVWQQTDTYPDGDFVLASLDNSGGSVYTAIGRLTFHGVTRELRFPVSVIRESGRYAIAGEVLLDTRQFGLPVIRKLGILKVDPVVRVRFQVQGSVPPVGATGS